MDGKKPNVIMKIERIKVTTKVTENRKESKKESRNIVIN